MESQYKKWVQLSYLVFAVAVGYVFFAFAAKLIGAYDLEARVREINLITQGVAVAIGAILFGALYVNPKANQFMNEVMEELSRVTWPTQKETTSATFIVIIMVIISGIVLGLLDYFWVSVLKWIL